MLLLEGLAVRWWTGHSATPVHDHVNSTYCATCHCQLARGSFTETANKSSTGILMPQQQSHKEDSGGVTRAYTRSVLLGILTVPCNRMPSADRYHHHASSAAGRRSNPSATTLFYNRLQGLLQSGSRAYCARITAYTSIGLYYVRRRLL
jgi:hypothetical protein